MRFRLRNFLLGWLLLTPSAFADTSTSTTTLTIDPSATSGATITAADENDRNNDASTWANAHVHSLSNSTNLGDAAAGNKSLCFDAADSTDMCIRFDDTANLITMNSPQTGTYSQVVTMSGTSGISSTALLKADGTGSIVAYNSSAGADDGVLVADSSTAGTFRNVPNCTDASGNHLNYTQSTNSFSCGTSASTVAPFVGSFTRDTTTASGTQAVTGVGFQPSAVIFFMAEDASSEASQGFSTDTADNCTYDQHNVTASTWSVDGDDSIHDEHSNTQRYEGDISSLDSDGFTINWTRTSTPTGTITIRFMAFD